MKNKIKTISNMLRYTYYKIIDAILIAKDYIKNILLNKGERIDPSIQENNANITSHLNRYIFVVKMLNKYKYDYLDIACGTGYGTKILAGVGVRVIGVDLSRKAILYARLKYKLPNLRYETKEFMNYKQKHDVVVSFETLEHLSCSLTTSINHIVKLANKIVIGSVPYNEIAGMNHHHHHFNITEKDIKKAINKYAVNFYYQDNSGIISSQKNNNVQNLIFTISK